MLLGGYAFGALGIKRKENTRWIEIPAASIGSCRDSAWPTYWFS